FAPYGAGCSGRKGACQSYQRTCHSLLQTFDQPEAPAILTLVFSSNHSSLTTIQLDHERLPERSSAYTAVISDSSTTCDSIFSSRAFTLTPAAISVLSSIASSLNR